MVCATQRHVTERVPETHFLENFANQAVQSSAMGDFSRLTQFFVDSLRSYVNDAVVDVAKAQMDFEEKILIKFPLSTADTTEQKKTTPELVSAEKKSVLDFSFRKYIEQLIVCV